MPGHQEKPRPPHEAVQNHAPPPHGFDPKLVLCGKPPVLRSGSPFRGPGASISQRFQRASGPRGVYKEGLLGVSTPPPR
jgi:hypothetical protein